MHIYPMKLEPIPREILWGGDKLKTDYHKSASFAHLAESWELTIRGEGVNQIAGGVYDGMKLDAYLSAADPRSLTAGRDGRFPLLIKLIDARDRLSVQVHPDDDYALSHVGEPGKTEVWHILEAEPGASIVYGLKDGYDRETFMRALEDGTVESLLNRVPVQAGETYFIPAGLVHAIGAGILIAEIQQNSNTTYRVYDYNRRQADGSLRPLHIDSALDVIRDFSDEEIAAQRFACRKVEADAGELLASCPYFSVEKRIVSECTALPGNEKDFRLLLCTDGEGALLYQDDVYPIAKGDSYFLPAGIGEMTVRAEGNMAMLISRA